MPTGHSRTMQIGQPRPAGTRPGAPAGQIEAGDCRRGHPVCDITRAKDGEGECCAGVMDAQPARRIAKMIRPHEIQIAVGTGKKCAAHHPYRGRACRPRTSTTGSPSPQGWRSSHIVRQLRQLTLTHAECVAHEVNCSRAIRRVPEFAKYSGGRGGWTRYDVRRIDHQGFIVRPRHGGRHGRNQILEIGEAPAIAARPVRMEAIGRCNLPSPHICGATGVITPPRPRRG